MSKLLKISISIFLVSFLLRLVICNHMSVKTTELNAVNTKILEEESRISEINQQIFLASSVSKLETKAYELGFAKMTEPVKTISNPVIAKAY